MFEEFEKRSYRLERLDTGDYSQKEYMRWHREMYFIHRIFGEFRALRKTIGKDIASDNSGLISILDVGAGTGGVIAEVQKWFSDRVSLSLAVEIEREAARAIRSIGLQSVQADALKLPFADDSFDYVYCTLLLHHLGDDAAVTLLTEMKRVARKRFYIVDLNREPIAYYAYRAIGWLFLQNLTSDDGALSILRSFRPVELLELAKKAGLHDVRIEHSRLNRLILSGN